MGTGRCSTLAREFTAMNFPVLSGSLSSQFSSIPVRWTLTVESKPTGLTTPTGVPAYSVRRVTFPVGVPLNSTPEISLTQIRERRFNLIDRARQLVVDDMSRDMEEFFLPSRPDELIGPVVTGTQQVDPVIGPMVDALRYLPFCGDPNS